jgi:hypothetical protein
MHNGFADHGGYTRGVTEWTMYLTCFEFAINAMVMGYGVT